MSTLRTRLRKLATGRLCRIHHRRLTCAMCDRGELPPDASAELERLHVLVGVLSPTGEVISGGEPRIAGACWRCGQEMLYCLRCQPDPVGRRYADAYAALTPEQRERLDTLLQQLIPPRLWRWAAPRPPHFLDDKGGGEAPPA